MVHDHATLLRCHIVIDFHGLLFCFLTYFYVLSLWNWFGKEEI